MQNKKFIVSIIIFVIIGNSIFYLLDLVNQKKLQKEKSSICKGFVDRKIKSGSGGKVIVIYFNVKNYSYSIIESDNNDFIQKGDTVLVKYLVGDPSIAKVIDFCYMQKHKGKCK